jgi:hypothetical protein
MEGEIEDPAGAKAVAFSHGDSSFVVQTLNDAAREQFLTTEIVKDEFAMAA